MCIQMTHDYNHTMIVNLSLVSPIEDDNIFINIRDDPPPLVPIQSPHMGFEYLHLINQMQQDYKENEQYENIQYIFGTIISIYGIYYFVSKIIDSIYKKYI
jgi:hypothetical protein